jgi:hypothetical protein
VDLENVRAKSREAEFFLGEMLKQEPRFIGDERPFAFGYYLSAFLNAARTVDYRLRHEHGAIYKPWRAAWDGQLSAGEDRLLKFMADDRIAEVHKTGSTRVVGREGVQITGVLPDGQGTITEDRPPGAPPGEQYRPTYLYEIDGIDRRVTEVCREHLTLLERMVTEFEAAHP